MLYFYNKYFLLSFLKKQGIQKEYCIFPPDDEVFKNWVYLNYVIVDDKSVFG